MTSSVNESSRQIDLTLARTTSRSIARRARNLLLLATGAALSFTGLGAIGAPAAQASATDSSGFIYTDNGTSVSIQGCDATCSGASVTIPSTITVGGNSLPVTSVATNGWSQVGQITSLTIPNSVTSVGTGLAGKDIVGIIFAPGSPIAELPVNVFYSMPSLTSLTLPDQLHILPNGWVQSSQSLTSIVLPNSITTIGNGLSGTGINTTNLPTSLVTIGDYAWGNMNRTFGAVTLPAGVTSIGEGAFRSAGVTSLTLNSGLQTIGGGAFSANSLTSIVIPDSVTTISLYAFVGNSLTSVTIGNSVTSIGQNAFDNATLTSVTVPARVRTLGTRAFGDAVITFTPPVFTGLTPSAGTAGSLYTTTFDASGALLAVKSGDSLPPGLTLDASTGVLSGTPTAGTYTFRLVATNADPASTANASAPSNTSPYTSNPVNITISSPLPAPTITGVSPSSGNTFGGSPITITGANFTSGASFGVTVGGVAATDVTLASSTSITATTPTGTSGPVDVVVTNGDGQSAASTGGFTYVTASPSPDPTPTPSGGGESSPAPTPTPTPTPTASAKPTVVPTPTATSTASASASASPTVTTQPGFVQLSAAETANAQTPVVNAPLSTNPASAPVLTIPPGTPVAPVVSGLPTNTNLRAGFNRRTRAKDVFVTFGTTRSNANGRAKVPAFKPSRAGTYTIQLATADGKAFYLKVKVTAKAKPVKKPTTKPSAMGKSRA